MKYFIGIDPGKDGGIAILNNNGEIVFKTNSPQIGKEADLHKIDTILKSYVVLKQHHVIMEDVHSIFGMSAKSNFSFGKNVGHLEGMLIGMGTKYTLVAPKKWQKEMWEGIPEQRKPGKEGKKGPIDTKTMSLLAVKRLFPGADLRKSERSTKAHDGIVDALLLAEYCRRNY